ncbi:MAG TPA: VWA domain-containing protein [Caldilineae bacterium]|nr:VWA domain-containing protein [Caldilineae bacterium]
MKSAYSRIWVLILLVMMLLIPSGRASASPDVQAGASAPVDIVLLIDDSGSMSDWWADGRRPPNDPEGLRHSAARLFIDLARPGDRIAVISFHTTATGYGAAAEGEFDVISDQASRDQLKAAIVQPTEPEDPMERLTDMRRGLRMAQDLLKRNLSGNRQFIIFLTDGRPYPTDQRPELFQVISELGQAGIPIFPILLGGDADTKVANRMALETHSVVQQVDSPSDLLRAYATIYSYIQPNRYVDVLDLIGGQIGTVKTSEEQGVTELSIVLPKARDASAAFADLTHDGTSILGSDRLDNGATITRVVDEHYEMITISHNSPLVGEWVARALQAVGSSGLVVAESMTTIQLLYPQPAADADSTAAPRYYPVGKPVFLGATVQSADVLMTGLPLVARVGGVQYPMTTEGLTKDGSLYWAIIPAQPGTEPGSRTRVQIQIGDQITPLRLRKEFVLEAGEFPPLIVDSPTERSDGVLEEGRLLLRVHFEGAEPPQDARVEAIIQDMNTGDIARILLACAGGVCEDKSFTPTQGRQYHVLFLATATTADGIVYNDFAEGSLTMRDALRLESLPSILDLGRVPLYQDTVERELTLSAYTEQPFQLKARVELQSATPGVRPGQLTVSLARPTHVGGNRYKTLLTLSGFDQLAPGQYAGTVTFDAGKDLDVQPSNVPLKFSIPEPEIRLTMPGSVDLGEIRQPREPREFQITAEFTEGTASEIEGTLTNLTLNGQPVGTDHFTVLVGQPIPRGEEGHTFTIPVRLTAIARPPAGVYRGDIIFTSPSGLSIEPRRIQVVFNVPQPKVILSLEGDVLDFGDVTDLSQPTSVPIYMELKYIDGPPRIDVALSDVRHSGGSVQAASALGVRTGVIQQEGEGYRMPLLLSAEGKVPPGVYQGTIVLRAAEGVVIQPSKISFTVRQLTTMQALGKWLAPVGSFFRTWFWPLPPIRITGFVGWLVLLVLINTGLRLRPAAPQEGGVVIADASGEMATVPRDRPLYLVMGSEGVGFSTRQQDRVRALAIVDMEQRVTGSSTRASWRAVLKSNPIAPTQVRVSYWRPETGRWRLVGEQGHVLSPGTRFRVRLVESGDKYYFRYMDEG